MPEEPKTYTGLPRRYGYGGPALSREEMDALAKRAFQHAYDLQDPAAKAKASIARETAAKAKAEAKEAKRVYMTGLRTALREAKAELKAMRRLCRDYERADAKGELSKQDHGGWEEADARLWYLVDRVNELTDMRRRGY